MNGFPRFLRSAWLRRRRPGAHGRTCYNAAQFSGEESNGSSILILLLLQHCADYRDICVRRNRKGSCGPDESSPHCCLHAAFAIVKSPLCSRVHCTLAARAGPAAPSRRGRSGGFPPSASTTHSVTNDIDDDNNGPRSNQQRSDPRNRGRLRPARVRLR